MNLPQWSGMAGILAAAAVVASAWRQIMAFMVRMSDLFIARVALKEDAAPAVIAFAWRRGKFSPFAMRLFGGRKAFINKTQRVEVVGYEGILSQPILIWFNRRPMIVSRPRFDSAQSKMNLGENTQAERTVLIWFIRGTFDTETFLKTALDWFNDLLKEVRVWLEHEKWYREKGIPWRRGWLLHGKPGTGKSTLVRSVAMEFDLPVWVFDLSVMDNDYLVEMWKNLQQNAPAIDVVFEGRKNVSSLGQFKQKLSFDCLLNVISGVGNSDGVFLFITTNNIEKLDEALGIPRGGISTRPGRIDRVLELLPMATEERRAVARHILDRRELIEQAIEEGDGETAAQFQNRCAQMALEKFWKEKV